MRKINLWRIVQGHFGTLCAPGEAKPSWGDVLLFVASPIGFGALIAWLGLGFSISVLDGLLDASAILAGLLLNLLVLVFSYTQSGQVQYSIDPHSAIRRRLIREIHANISFAILVSLAIVATTIIAIWWLPSGAELPSKIGVTQPIFSFCIVALSGNFLLTIMMVLKRMYALIDYELERVNFKKSA